MFILEGEMSPEQAPSKIGKSVGERLRAARIARNYTQGQLAAPDFSVSYISAIERGQIHPSLRALEILATRLGIPSTQLLPNRAQSDVSSAGGGVEREEDEEELLFLNAEMALWEGRATQVISTLERLIPKRLTRPQLLQQRYLLGRAYLEAGRTQESLQVLTEAIELAKELHNDTLHLRSLYLLGTVYATMHNYAQALLSHQRCLHLLQEMPAPDVYFQVQIYTALGQHYLAQDNAQNAQEMFQEALALLTTLTTMQAARDYYWQRCQHYREAGQYEAALSAAYKSLYLQGMVETQRHRSELHYYLCQALFKADPGEADAYLTRMLHEPGLQRDPLSLACVALYKAKLHIDRQELSKAEQYLTQAQHLIEEQGDSLIAAEVLLTSGQFDYMLQRYSEGDRHFVGGLEMLQRMGHFQELAGRAVSYARLLEERGMEHEALIYYKLAFQSSQKVGE
jgi:tetratricopeptide (TPR) repeat protein